MQQGDDVMEKDNIQETITQKLHSMPKKDLEQKFVDIPVEKMHFAVAYSGARTAEVDAWVEEVKTVFPQATIEVVAPLSLSVSCHIGAGALAITLTAPIK